VQWERFPAVIAQGPPSNANYTLCLALP
jgi:hypothetical protein